MESYRISYPKSFWNRHRFGLLLIVLCVFFSTSYSSLIMGGAGILFILYGSRSLKKTDGEYRLLLLAYLSFGLIRFLFHGESILFACYFSLTPIFMYCLGKYYMMKWNHVDILLLILFFMAVVLAAPHIIVTIKDIMAIGLINPTRELQIAVDDEVVRAITQRTIELSPGTIGFTLFFYKPQNSFQKKMRLFLIVLAILSLLCFVHYVSRTGIVLSLITIFSGLLFAKSSMRNHLYIALFVAILIIVFIIAHEQITEIYTIYAEREIEGSSMANAGGRTGQWEKILVALSDYPLGHKTDTFAHNMWLDIGKGAGIAPFIFLSLFSISSLLKTYKIATNKQYYQLTRMLVLSASLVFFLSCFTECIHEGAPMYMFFYCMYCGMVNSIYYNREHQRI